MAQTTEINYSEEVRRALEQYMDENGLTRLDMGRKLGFSPTRISKYLNLNKEGRKLEPDVPEIEQSARELLRHAALKIQHTLKLQPNSVSERLAAALRTITQTNDIGLVHGPAGIGKTCGAILYAEKNPRSLFLTVSRYKRTMWDVAMLLFRQVENGRWPGNESKVDWLQRQLENSDRLIIVDNAHKLSREAIEFLFDLHDATGCPIGLVGNPEVMGLVNTNDQLFSRIGLCVALKFMDQGSELTRAMAEQIMPDGANEIMEEAEMVAQHCGHARTLKKQLVLAGQIKTPAMAWKEAFQKAGAKLVKPEAR